MNYYVDAAAEHSGDGSREHPFRRIQEAAELAKPGDEVLAFPGIYREYVNPQHAGRPDARIIYRSIEPLKAVITGAELLRGWKPLVSGRNCSLVWTVRVPNSIFGDYNPYTTLVRGDWFRGEGVHTGDVYLNHKSMYEASSLQEVMNPKPSKVSRDPGFSVYVWYAEQDPAADETVFYANFQGLDPNSEDVEFSVRQDCFLPSEEGVGYITLSGFTVREAATQWAPPTAYQDGMIGPHWSKGWIIEDCDIYESKCSGISLGKYLQPSNNNKWSEWRYKDGTQTERDCICEAANEGWDKEHIGSHIIRHCNIHDCGQTGIVGHMGGVFSLIEDNHIHDINNKRNLVGEEIGGIKMHAAIDVIIRRNHIHNCTRGIWLDWQAQGTRVTQNLFHDNTLAMDRSRIDFRDPDTLRNLFTGMGEDIFIEVSHGPTLVDNNILLSERAVKFASQGGAFVHNLIAGSLTCIGTGTDNGAVNKPSPRYTPYHVPHGTAIAGFMTILHGDTRFYNNIFVQKPVFPVFHLLQEKVQQMGGQATMWDTMNFDVGTFVYDDYPDYETWKSWFEPGREASHPDRYYDHLPVWASGNVYLGGARPWKGEKDAFVDDHSAVKLELVRKTGAGKTAAQKGNVEKNGMVQKGGMQQEGMEKRDLQQEVIQWEGIEESGGLVLDTNIYDLIPARSSIMISTETLGMAFEPEELFENPDGSQITFDCDFFGRKRSENPVPGPLTDPEETHEPLDNSDVSVQYPYRNLQYFFNVG